ncbi:MAG: DUF4111 domain-containing protein, partial [Acidimicrobiia bacterium]|nr:DUF4111 domain-containing protein [Acidimicrobiia bacterium]
RLAQPARVPHPPAGPAVTWGELPATERAYVGALTGRLQESLGPDLLGLYLFGSAAYGGYRPGRSDLDVQGVVRRALCAAHKRALAGRLLHASLPCPAKGLELVLYRAEVAARPSAPPPFEINLNTGVGVAERVGFDISAEPAAHWFVLDLAIGRETGLPLVGPPPEALIGPTPRPVALAAALESVRWHRAAERDLSNAVLNAARARRFARAGRWGPKDAAGEWEVTRGGAAVVVAALAARRSPEAPALDPIATAAYLAEVEEELHAAVAKTDPGPVSGRHGVNAI